MRMDKNRIRTSETGSLLLIVVLIISTNMDSGALALALHRNKVLSFAKASIEDTRNASTERTLIMKDLLADDQTNVVTVVGTASLEFPDHKKRAKLTGLWKAVKSNLVRRHVPIEQIEKHATKIQRLIESEPKRIFPEVTLLEEAENKDLYSVRLRARFIHKNLDEWMFINGVDLATFYRWWGCPSFVVAVQDMTEGQNLDMGRAHIYIQNALLERGFNVKKGKMLKKIQQDDVKLFAGDNKKVNLALAREHNSEIIVLGACIVRLREKLQLAGQPVYACDSILRLEIVDSANADIITSKEWIYHAQLDEYTTAFSKDRAIEKSQTKLLDLYSSSIIYEILHNYFEWKITNELKFVNIRSIDRKSILACVKSIDDLEFIADKFDGAVMDIKVKYGDDPERIIEAVEKVLGFYLVKKDRGLLYFEKRKNQ